jgi:lambda repressor-like predicted transcriptional regulator
VRLALPSCQEAYRVKNQKETSLADAWDELERGALLREAADKCAVNRRTLIDRLRKEDPDRYKRIMESRGTACKTVDLAPVWIQVENGRSISRIANEVKIRSSTLRKKLRMDNPQKYEAIMKERKRSSEQSINLDAAWTEIKSGKSVIRVATERKVSSAKLYYRLQRKYGDEYRRVTLSNRRRPGIQIPMEAWQRLERGESLTKLSTEYGISLKTIRKRLQQIDQRRYRRIRVKYGSTPRPTLPFDAIRRRFCDGEPITKLCSEYGVSFEFMSHRLKATLGHRYHEYVTRGRQKRKTQNASKNVPNQMWKRLERGETIEKVATAQGICGKTLSYRLQQIDKDRYRRIMDKRKVRLPPESELWRKLEHGQSLTKLAEECNIPRRTLSRKLQRANPKKYKKTMRAVNQKNRLTRAQLSSLRRRRIQGADSRFELQVRQILQRHQIQFEIRPRLKLGENVYFPDFLLPQNVIVEAAAVSFKTYWIHYRKKTQSYIEHGYSTVVVVPASLRRKAEAYLPRQRTVVVRVGDLDELIEQLLVQEESHSHIDSRWLSGDDA